jgi:hypothetical protein
MKQTTFEEFTELAKRGTFRAGVPGDHGGPADAGVGVSEGREHSDYAFLLEASKAASRSAAIRSSARIRF